MDIPVLVSRSQQECAEKTNVSDRRPLRTMFLLTSMPVGGAETLLVNLVRRFDRQKIVPEIGCLKARGPLGDELVDEMPVHGELLKHKYDFGIVRRLKRLLMQRQIDAVVTVGAGDKMFWGRLAARVTGVPVILSALHSTGWPDGVGRMNRLLTPITDGFIAVAQSHGKFLVDFEKFPEHKVHVIPNGIDTERFQFSKSSRNQWRSKLAIDLEAPVCGIVAALRPEKNHLLFLDVAERVLQRAPNARFVIVGDGPLMPSLQQRVARTPLENAVCFAGSCSDVPGLLSAFDLFALTSDNEASPVSILEAFACERPVVATDVGSISETVIEGENGFLVPTGDADAAADRWEKLLSNEKLRQQFGSSGRQCVCQQASLDSMVAGYQSLIHRTYLEKVSA